MSIHTWHWLLICGGVGLAIGLALAILLGPDGDYDFAGPIIGCALFIIAPLLGLIVGLVLWLAGASLTIGVTVP